LRQQLGEAKTLNKSKNTGKQKKSQEGGQDAEDRSDQADKAWQRKQQQQQGGARRRCGQQSLAPCPLVLGVAEY
jgi:hypothetical protein